MGLGTLNWRKDGDRNKSNQREGSVLGETLGMRRGISRMS